MGAAVGVRFKRRDGTDASCGLDRLPVDEVLLGRPVRDFRCYKGRRFYSGWFWSATTGGLVAYVSRLELARILLADFDQTVVGIAATRSSCRATASGTGHCGGSRCVRSDPSRAESPPAAPASVSRLEPDGPMPRGIDQVRANRSPADISSACMVALPVCPESSIIRSSASGQARASSQATTAGPPRSFRP
jgi:hypothetical protein